MAFIEVNNVVKQYDGHLALDNVSLEVPEGCVYGLLGPNGAGKTTLIRILNRITLPDSGTVLFRGSPANNEVVKEIGYLPEERGLYKKMKVGDQIVYLARLKGMEKGDATREMVKWLERFNLSEWRNRKVEELSKGMAQKVQFIATVIHRPPLLIFDEPFSGFDPVNAELLKREILNLRDEGATILFSTHNMSSVEAVCEEISLINHSKVVLQGNVMDIRRSHSKHLYRVEFSDNMPLVANEALFSVEKSEKGNAGGTCAEIRLNAGVDVRDAIAYMNEKYHLCGFSEQLPDMNEVFIETVSKQ